MGAYDVDDDQLQSTDIAIVGMAARFPGAPDVFRFWANLRDGVESIQFPSAEALRRAGVPDAHLTDPRYVRATAPIDGLSLFDPKFFGFSPREASVLDPQHRHFLEVCWEALESAGILPEAAAIPIGVFAGSGMNAYLPYHLFTNPDLMQSMGLFLVRHTGNDKDFLATRVSYCLDLKGPSINVQTACSTSLVAVHMACQSLLSGECGVALAGGVTLELPHGRGYFYEEGEILSPDGHCRPFEERSKGTVFGSGAGVVVLKRLADAIADGDYIHALIKGTSVNNDGSRKIGYLAPSVDGQAECVVEALQVAGLTARDISYVECHGTGTPVGDPIELTALTRAFSRTNDDRGYCGVGSVKSNIGHLDTAAGVASLIKVAQMLEHEQLAPTLHFERPNPQIDFAASPFYVVHERAPWPKGTGPRRAGVSSLGVGGTNAHAILEEAPRRRSPAASDKPQLLLLAARSQGSLDEYAARLSAHLAEHPDLVLSEVSSTLLRGRRRFAHRRVLAAKSSSEAAELLARPDTARVFDVHAPGEAASVVFVFPGGGAQYPNMAREVYESEAVFRDALDECLSVLERQENIDLRPLLFVDGDVSAAARELERPSLALPALFSIEIAYARLLDHWGVRPAALIGHSLGEYAALHLSGVLELGAALAVVCCRGRLFEKVRRGGMLSVPMPSEQLAPLLEGELSIAAINAPDLCVVSGSSEALERLERDLLAQDVHPTRLRIDVPAHSPLLDPILDEFAAALTGVTFHAPRIPFVSNLSGRFPEAAEIDARYLVRHLRETVRFAAGVAGVLERHPDAIFVEVGPGQTLTSTLRANQQRPVVPVSPHAKDRSSDVTTLVTSVGRIAAHGGSVDFERLLNTPRTIVPLPATPFEHEPYWIEPGKGYFGAAEDAPSARREPDASKWFFQPSFSEADRGATTFDPAEVWLLFADEGPLCRALELELRARGIKPAIVTPGATTERLERGRYQLRLAHPEDYETLLQHVVSDAGVPARIVHTLCLSPELRSPEAPLEPALDRCFYSLLHLAQALARESLHPDTRLLVACSGVFDDGGGSSGALAALAEGPVRVIPKELPEVRAVLFEVPALQDSEATARSVLLEAAASEVHEVTTERDGRRLAQIFTHAPASDAGAPLPPEPIVLIAGGLGGIGSTLAKHFADTLNARLVLVTRHPFPEREHWAEVLEELGSSDPLAGKLKLLLELSAAGHEVVVESGDLASRAETDALLDRVKARFGRVDVVVQAAGVLDDAPLAVKTRAAARAVLAPKLDASRHLVEALAQDPPALLLLISSTSAVLGPPGQIDYAAANSYLNALGRELARRYSEAGTRVLSLGFGVWKEVGMAARALSRVEAPAEGDVVGHPLLGRLHRERMDQLGFRATYSPRALWVMDQHRVRGGTAVLPGTGFVEIVRAAGARALGLPDAAALELSDLLFARPLSIPDGAERQLEVVTDVRSEPATVTVTISSRGKGEPSAVEHARGSLRVDQAPAPAPLDLDAIRRRCGHRSQRFEERQELPQDRHLALGRHWQVIREMHFGTDEALALLRLPEELRGEQANYALHPGLLDMASGFAFSLADTGDAADLLRIPLSYERLTIRAPLPAELMSHVRLRSAPGSDGVAVFDLQLADLDGKVVATIDGYVTKSMPARALTAPAAPATAPSPLERWFEEGLTLEEGLRVVDRVLRSGWRGEVVATPVPLETLAADLKPARVEARPSAPTAEAQREDAPRDEIERSLAEMWCALLGVSSVGIHDNFFELGGHSLIAVRLFSRIKKTHGVDLSLAVLFQAPTIEQCADILRERLGKTLEVPKNGRAAPERPNGRPAAHDGFNPLVLIQKGSPERPPFICVHGAGGNVLNFYDLARRLPSNQAFYGLQALGVNGETPLQTIEDMGRLYVEQLSQIDHSGPYVLGGYSGGGVVALEMAHQLIAQGKQVRLVVLFDTFEPSTRPRKPALADRITKLLQGGTAYLSERSRAKWSRHLNELSAELKLRFYLSQQQPLPLELRELQLTRSFYEASARYRARRYEGRVILFRADRVAEVFQHVGPTLGWDGLLPGLEIVEVPGTHDSLILEPNVSVLTAHLKRALEEAPGPLPPVSRSSHAEPA